MGRTSWVGSVDPVELAKNCDKFHEMKYPTTVLDEELFELGLIKVPDGVTVFVENVRGSRLRQDDIVKVIAVGEDELRANFPSQVANLASLREKILGPVDERDARLPSGGTAFERMKRRKRNGQGGRSYSTALTTEPQRGLTHPADNIRTHADKEGQLDDEQLLYKELNEVNI